MDQATPISLTVNGAALSRHVEPRQSLVDFLRYELELTGSHVGCEHGVCGACTVRVDGAIVRGCLMLAVQCDGYRVETIEGVAGTGEIFDLQQAFARENALQCGFCTPGMLLTAQDLLARTAGRGRAGDPRSALGQLLPLHGLSRHRRGGAEDGGGKGARMSRMSRAGAISARAWSGHRPRDSSPAAASSPTTSCCRGCFTSPS